jgi:2-polyprenyl-6-hydroxyphenyl methylase/3-demethylubiquinone-9 3-methyltransferase
VWALGDYHPIADMLRPAAQDLLDACAISAGQEILDVGAGTGNLALLAAEEGASVTASDLTPEMVEKGRARTEAAGVDVEWVVADAEDLPFDDDSFECVASVFGAIFAPRPEVMIAELFRVVRPGGTVGLTAWGDFGVQAEVFGTLDKYRPPSPFPEPRLWGDEKVVEERLAPHAARIQAERVSFPYGFDSFDQMWEAFSNNGPLVALRQTIPPEEFEGIRQQIFKVIERHNKATDGSLRADPEYLRIVARKRG